MAYDPASLEYALNVIRRQIRDEFPDLTLVFIDIADMDPREALKRKRDEILGRPAGPALYAYLEKKVGYGMKDGFCVLAGAKEKNFFQAFLKAKRLGCVFFNSTNDVPKETMDARRRACFLTWRALYLLKETKKNKSALKDSEADPETDAWRNMLADSFAALTMEKESKKGFIVALARKRAEQALRASDGGKPEDYPYPVILDAVAMIFREWASFAGPKTLVFSWAFDMAREIGSTFDLSAVRQWQAFCRPAQEMAWLGIDESKILSAACHTSEDPFARSTAYLVAEILRASPPPFSDISVYNSFTDPEANERHHRKIAEESFENIPLRMDREKISERLKSALQKENEKLLAGRIIGWSAPALLAAIQECASVSEGDSLQARLQEAYKRELQKMSGEFLRKLAHAIIQINRAGDGLALKTLAASALEDDDLRAIVPALLFERK